MRKLFSKIAFTAALGFAMAFTFSCGEHSGGGSNDDPPPSSVVSSSSGSDPALSSGSSSSNDDNIPLSSGSSSSGGVGNSSSSEGTSSSSSAYSACTAANNTSTQYCSNGTIKTYGSTPALDGRTYKTVVIGDQVWMAENLDYAATGSLCYNDDIYKCTQYGRLYTWATAMNVSENYNTEELTPSEQHQGICPDGWHIPNNAEWDKLYHYVDGTSGTESPYRSEVASRYLKSISGWSYGDNGEDTYGFAALPGGWSNSYGSFYHDGEYGNWWSATEINDNNVYHRCIYCSSEAPDWYFNYKYFLLSVRCLKDY
ncbi:hypothetical protein R83H12_01154 [Fibrobacteria bacterium R8-3-H12]